MDADFDITVSRKLIYTRSATLPWRCPDCGGKLVRRNQMYLVNTEGRTKHKMRVAPRKG